MKTLTQRYRMIVDDPQCCALGQMVTDDINVIGFLSNANNNTGICEVILFSPKELEFGEGMEHIEESVPDALQQFETILGVAIPEVQETWKEAVKKQIDAEKNANN
jgi:hypothetical protein